MLILHLAAGVVDAGSWNVTTTIAAIGAVICVATLVVTNLATSRRERAKWARVSLAEAFFEFVDASYAAGQAAKDHFHAQRAGAGASRLEALMDRCGAEMSKLIHLQTKIRLLAPARTLGAAKELRTELDTLRGSLEDGTTPETHRRLVMEAV